MKKFWLLLAIGALSSCSFAPFTSTKNGRSLGKGNFEINAGFSPASSATVGYGVSENTDVGIIVEEQVGFEVAAWGKYSFINKKDGLSFAAYGGVFTAFDTTNTKGAFVAPVFSYRASAIEFYLAPKLNYAGWDAGTISSDTQSDSIFDNLNWDSGSITYLQTIFGVNFWFSDSVGLNVNGQLMTFFQAETTSDSIIPGVELLFRF